jgi:hypothetical protein
MNAVVSLEINVAKIARLLLYLCRHTACQGSTRDGFQER